MENKIMNFEGKEVEVFEWNGQILFNPYHCGECLDLSNVTVRRHIQSMNDKQVVKLNNLDVQNMNIRKLNNAGENFLTESGVYKLIFKSHKEEAEKFQDWVTDEVLPQIRKTGGYIPVTDEMSDMEILSRAMIISQKTINNQKRIINKQQRRIVSLEEDIETLNNKLLLSQGQVNMIVSALKQRYFDLHGKIG